MTGSQLDIAGLLNTGGTLHLEAGGSEDWRKITEASLDEYRSHHAADGYEPHMLEIMAMFEGCLAKWAGIWEAESVLDLGCGIGGSRPPYARNLPKSLVYAGLDPLNETPEREYPFVRGRLEDLADKELNKKFDMAVFATSLDHFEDARNALALAAKVTGKGRVLVWCGLHDSPLIARINIANWIDRLCRDNRAFFSRSLAFLTYALLTWPRVAMALSRREKKLAAGRPLDKLHFHYFTEQKLRALLEDVGQVHEFSRCPGSNAVFAAITVSPKTE